MRGSPQVRPRTRSTTNPINLAEQSARPAAASAVFSGAAANTGANLQPGPIEYDGALAEDRRRPADVRSTSVETTPTRDRVRFSGSLCLGRSSHARSRFPSERRQRLALRRNSCPSIAAASPVASNRRSRRRSWLAARRNSCPSDSIAGVPSPAADRSPAGTRSVVQPQTHQLAPSPSNNPPGERAAASPRVTQNTCSNRSRKSGRHNTELTRAETARKPRGYHAAKRRPTDVRSTSVKTTFAPVEASGSTPC